MAEAHAYTAEGLRRLAAVFATWPDASASETAGALRAEADRLDRDPRWLEHGEIVRKAFERVATLRVKYEPRSRVSNLQPPPSGGSMRLHTEKRRLASSAVWIAVVLLMTGCASTRLRTTWVNPNASSVSIHRVVAIALSNDPVRRRMMEASMVAQIREKAPGVTAIESSTLINDQDLRNEEAVRGLLERADVDAELVMRVTGVRRSDVYVPGQTTYVPEYYRTFWGYYRYWTPIAYQPGYVEPQRDVQVETELYAKPNGDLMYSALSRTLNPGSAADLAQDATSVVAEDLNARGLLGQVSREGA
jgi:hypothetical protein